MMHGLEGSSMNHSPGAGVYQTRSKGVTLECRLAAGAYHARSGSVSLSAGAYHARSERVTQEGHL